jgi:hypothetical protein
VYASVHVASNDFPDVLFSHTFRKFSSLELRHQSCNKRVICYLKPIVEMSGGDLRFVT